MASPLLNLGLSASGGGGGLSDGDKGDIVVSGDGTTLTIDSGVVSTSKMGGDVTTAGKALLDDANAATQRATLGIEHVLGWALSDESTAITTGLAKVTDYVPADCTVLEVFTGLSAQSSSGVVTTNVKVNGSTIFSTKPSIDANAGTSLTGTAAALSTTSLTKGDKLTFDIDAAGTGAKGLKVWMRVRL